MSLFKCKMCGGSLEISADITVVTCEYCGTQQTLPKLDDDRRANLYDRANHFRRNNEFDKAMGIYEQILAEDNTDAEAYWSLVLCSYGIEYVEDPASHKRIPTVNRAQFTSVLADENYKSALQHADPYQRGIYESEAREFDEIQKGILAISQKEEPFDIFICYKESDNNGRRTPDSVLAQDLYYQLTQEGFKVFFSRITLEDKLGSAYEPYIFAALNSAKVMVVLGTKPEYFNAVWVKNEWSRYLALIKQGQKKILIPAYKDMDPYDLPEEFSHLQAQDMSKLGFMQDLIRGIKKIAELDTPKATVVKETVIAGGNANTAPLLKRAFMFLEDGDWDSANDYCEKVLDQDPENAEAYLGKLMAELRVKKQEDLKDCSNPFDEKNNYQKAMRFADEKLKTALIGYIEYINTRNENDRLEGIYNKATAAMNNAWISTEYENAAHHFETILHYKDSEILAAKCYENAKKARAEENERAEIARKDDIYDHAIALMNHVPIANTFSTAHFEKAIKAFQSINGWKDTAALIVACEQKIEELKAAEEAERLEKERHAEITHILAEMRAKRNKKIATIATLMACAIAAFIIVLNTVIIPNGKYNEAIALMDAGSYTKAIAAFEALNGYKDSVEKITECNYNNAIALMGAGRYIEAKSSFEAIAGYKDSKTKITECHSAICDDTYSKASALMDTGSYTKAISVFKGLNGYKDSAAKITDCKNKILKKAKIGDYVFFGTYEQDNNSSNGKEDVEWLVLEIKDGKALVISKYALDCKSYHTSLTNVTWETCSLRYWLNDKFLNSTFSNDEKAMIPAVTISADKDPDRSTDPGNATQDKVFLLSCIEAETYFGSNDARQCRPTDYAVANGSFYSDNSCNWWLRSPGGDQDRADIVFCIGFIMAGGNDVTVDDNAVRPALWITIPN